MNLNSPLRSYLFSMEFSFLFFARQTYTLKVWLHHLLCCLVIEEWKIISFLTNMDILVRREWKMSTTIHAHDRNEKSFKNFYFFICFCQMCQIFHIYIHTLLFSTSSKLDKFYSTRIFIFLPFVSIIILYFYHIQSYVFSLFIFLFINIKHTNVNEENTPFIILSLHWS